MSLDDGELVVSILRSKQRGEFGACIQFDFYCTGFFLWENPTAFGALWEVAVSDGQRTGRPRDLNLKPFLFYFI